MPMMCSSDPSAPAARPASLKLPQFDCRVSQPPFLAAFACGYKSISFQTIFDLNSRSVKCSNKHLMLDKSHILKFITCASFDISHFKR